MTARIGVTKRFDFMDVKAARAIGRLPAVAVAFGHADVRQLTFVMEGLGERTWGMGAAGNAWRGLGSHITASNRHGGGGVQTPPAKLRSPCDPGLQDGREAPAARPI